MKKEIHPKYYKDAAITCACGATHTIGSTLETIRVELCALCHPFYTGEQKIMDTARRVEKFEKRDAKKDESIQKKKEKRVARASQKAEKQRKQIEDSTIRPKK